jgi:6-phosphogluconolactonase (cycloisomerase 2 family)
MGFKTARHDFCISIVVAILLFLPSCVGKLFNGQSPLDGGFGGCSTNCAPSPEFLYATSTDHISAFSINPSTGALGTALTMAGPNQSSGMVASNTLGNLYVSDFLNDAVEGFLVNSSTGGLTAIAGSPFSLGGTPPGAGGLSSFVSAGSYLYATDLNAGTVVGFTYNSSGGTLTSVPGSPFPAGSTPVQAVQAGSQSKFLYVSNNTDSAGGISAYAIDLNTGALTPIAGSPFPTGAPGSFPGPSVMVANTNFLYVALAGSANPNNKVVGFAIDPTTGVLTALPGSPYVTGSDPLYVAVAPVTLGSQAFLYTANVQDGTISAFTADDNSGVLTPVTGSPYVSGTSIGGITVAPYTTGNGTLFLYAADPQAKAVRAYTIDGATGALSPIAGSPFQAGTAPALLTVVVP